MCLRILLADDSPLNQSLARRLLEKRGHAVTVVDNGREAVDAVRTGIYDVILMDVEMPVMDGIDATRMIRSSELDGRSRVPIVAVTTKDDPGACLAAGMDAFLPKPLRPEPLWQTLNAIVPRSAA